MTYRQLIARVLGATTLVAALAGAPLASATTMLDLEQFAAGSSHGDGLIIPFLGSVSGHAQIDNYLDRDITFFDSNYVNPPRVFCLQKQFGCGFSGAIYFSTAIADLSFVVEQTSTLSNVQATAYNGASIVGTIAWNDIPFDGSSYPTGPTRLFDFGGAGPITAVVVNSLGDTAFYGDFRFESVNQSVPAPALPALMLIALAGLVATRRT